MDAANGTDEAAADDDSSLYATGLELIGQFQAILGKMKAKQKRQLMQHFVPVGGGSSSSGGCGVGADSAVGVCSNNASSGSRAINRERQQHQPLLVTEPSELKLRLKLDTWMSESGELIVQPSLLAENEEANEAGYGKQPPPEHGDGGPQQLDSRSGSASGSSCSSSSSVSGGSGGGDEAGDAANKAGAAAAGAGTGGSHGNGSDNNSSNKSSRSNSADSENDSQQRRTVINRGAAVAGSNSLQQKNSGDFPQQAVAAGATKTAGRSHTYKDLGVIQGQLKQHQHQHLQHHQLKEKQQQKQQHRARIADSGGHSSSNCQHQRKHQHQHQHQQQHQQQHQLDSMDKAEKKVTTGKKEGNAAGLAGDSALQRTCHRCSYHKAA